MFWYRCKPDTPVHDFVKENDELKAENENLKTRLENLEKLLAQVNSDMTSAKPVINFDLMRVFSIERMANDNKPCTVIGYFINEPVVSGELVAYKDEIHQWYLYCNEKRHTELVEEFAAWKAKNN